MEKKHQVTEIQKHSWGFGGVAENLGINVIQSLAYNIFQIGMGMSPLVIGIAMGGSKVIEAISDPVFGSMSDNTRSRFGRRRPWIFGGAIITAIVFMSVWFVPRHIADLTFLGFKLSGAFLQAAYLISTISLFYLVFAIWQIPFSALGLEMVEDYAERTKLQTYKQVYSYIIGAVIGSLYFIVQMHDVWGGDEVTGARYVGLIAGCLILISAMLPAIVCRERFVIKHDKIPFWPSFMETLKDKPFRLLMGSLFFVFVSLFFMLPLLNYISIYYVATTGLHLVPDWSWHAPFTFHLVEKQLTNKEFAGVIGVYSALVQLVTQLGSTFLVNKAGKFVEKRTLLISGLVIGIFGYFSSWFFFTPNLPYLQIVPPIIVNIGLAACWCLIGSFSADICDWDELNTGKRREGMYAAVTGFLIKLSIAFVIAVSSWVLVQIGISGANPILSPSMIFTLRYMYILIPVTASLLAIFFIWKYPLTKAKVIEIQKTLNERRAENSHV